MGEFARSKAWVLPAIFAALLAGIGWNSYRTLEQSMKSEIASNLGTIRDATVAALVLWADEVEAVVNVHAARPVVRDAARELIELAARTGSSREALLASPAQDSLRPLMASVIESHGFAGWALVSLDGVFLAAGTDRNIGGRVPGIQPSLDAMASGQTIVTPPTLVRLLDRQPISLMLIGGPIRDEDGEVIAIFGVSMSPDRVYGRILVVDRLGESGETYAFDEAGLLVSQSRFDEQLREFGLLPEDPTIPSYLHIYVRNPGGDLTRGFEPTVAPRARPLTEAAASAVGGESGIDVEGYPGYRGVPVLGAWAWVHELGIGVASEIEVSEAYAPLHVLRRQFAFIVGGLAIGAVGMLIYSLVVLRLGREVEEARQLGRYKVERKLGSGGMATVYLARHALLRRPTAIKVLKVESAGDDAASDEAALRFEREVQVSSTLSHPNTIEIYDYGRSSRGDFYYAMEYVGGITLAKLIQQDGPQPDARVRFILQQATGSLAEAHALDLIHRDIKPANIMLCERGGMLDFVKVLDFGLVRRQTQSPELALTGTQDLTGTPLYMAPEAIKDPTALDARGDVYQIGAVAYSLLAGRPPFEGSSIVEVLSKHMTELPVPPGEVSGRPVSPALESVVMRCLSKKPEERYANAGELLATLEALVLDTEWGQAEARSWWATWLDTHPEEASDPASSTGGSSPSGYTIDILERIRRSTS